ncbi:MAG: PA14 domain-containing protein [Deltaproteobacteria bacterium]|nr:PA14 domain-containing protein [Deltaproteobacteria bacterium]
MLYVEDVDEEISDEVKGAPGVRARVDALLERARQAALAARVVLDTRGAVAKDAAQLLAAGWRSFSAALRAAHGADAGGEWLAALSGAADAWTSRLEGHPPRRDLRLALAELARGIRSLHAWKIRVLGSRAERRLRLAGRIALAASGAIFAAAIAIGVAVSLSIPDFDEGLTAIYYTKRGQAGHPFERIDHQVDFSWGRRSPMKGVGRDRFSVRWEGCLVVENGRHPTLVAGADEAIRVRIDGVKAIEDWKPHQFRTNSAKGGLKPGVHRIRVDYEDVSGEARVFLGWTEDGEPPRPIPAENLVPRDGNRKHKCP